MYITVKDLTNDRQSSLTVHDKSLRVVGVLPHGVEITFDRDNAKLLLGWLLNLLLEEG